MTSLEGALVRLRALEPDDIEQMYRWENDPAIWSVSGTTAPFSRHTLERFIEEQKYDIFATRQQRLVIETLTESKPLGILDLYDYDLMNSRAGVGILIHDRADRDRGYAADALEITCEYVRTRLRMHQLWCCIGVDNAPSLALFRSAGFEQSGIRRDWNFNGDNQTYIDEVFLQKILDDRK